MSLRQFFEKITGIERIRQQAAAEAAAAIRTAIEAEEEAKKQAAEEAERQRVLAEQEKQAKKTPKEIATERKEPWVAVLDTKVNADNPRNGFFELDWNEYFVIQLKLSGYGYDGDPEEEIVDRWFRDIARASFESEGLDVTRGAGYIDVSRITKNISEIS